MKWHIGKMTSPNHFQMSRRPEKVLIPGLFNMAAMLIY